MMIKHETHNTVMDDFGTMKELILTAREWFSYLFRNKFILFLTILFGAAAGAFYAYSKQPIYLASTTFVLEDEKSGGGLSSIAGLASIAGFNIGGAGGGIFEGDNILQLYKSRSMLEKTLLTQYTYQGTKQLLIERYIQTNKLREKWGKIPELANIQFSSEKIVRDDNRLTSFDKIRDSILGIIVSDLNKNYVNITKPDKKLATIQVDVRAKDEVFAKIFNDELVRNVNDFYITTKTKKTIENVEILQHKTDSVRAVMNGAIYSAVAVADATPNLNPTRQVQRVAPAQRAQFSAETNKTMLTELVKNLELSKIGLRKETPLIQVIDQPIFPLTNDKPSVPKSIIYFALISGLLCAIVLIFIKSFKEAIL